MTMHISTLRLHRLRLGELSPDEEGAIRLHLADCSQCAGRLDHQHQARLQFVASPTPTWAAPPALSLLERLGGWIWGLVAVPVLALAIAFLPEIAPPSAEITPAPDTRTKGDAPGLEAWIELGGSARPVYTNEALGAGTRLQLKFNAGQHRFVTLAGRDAAGVVEIYGTIPVSGSGLQTAPFALTLDNSKGSQIFFAVMSDFRLDPSQLQGALSKDPIRLDRAEVTSLTIQKE